MSEKLRIQYADAKGSIIELTGGGSSTGVLLSHWTGTPTASIAGFAPGSLAFDRTNAILYENVGTNTSATWKAIARDGATVAALTVTTLTATTANLTTVNPTSIVRASQTYQLGRGGTAKAGTTAGWVVNAGNNLGTIATVPQSQTGSTLVVAIPNLHVGDTITGFSVYSSINSGGNTVTLDANLRTLTIAAGASATDASVSSITQVSVTSATASTATKSGLSTVVAAGVNYYLLLTATTGATTTIELDQIEVTVTSA